TTVRQTFFSSGRSKNLLLRTMKFWLRSTHRPLMHSSGGGSQCPGSSSPYLAGGFVNPKTRTLAGNLRGGFKTDAHAVKQFRPGDEVFGVRRGAFAEYVCASENYLALKPANVPFEAAASVPIAALTALQGIRDHGKVQPGQTVLINGAGGGVGTFAVQ